MKKERLYAALGLLLAFAIWTASVCLIDVQSVGPQGTSVGFATLNCHFHNLTGVHMSLYTVTDWLSLVPLGFAMGFALLGLVQWVRRKRLSLVDRDILVLGGFYILVFTVYLLFEAVVVNYRPVLINGNLEVSYPSSTTMLVLCIMPTAMVQLHKRIANQRTGRIVLSLLALFSVFMVLGRLLSGVHWLSDIIGGILFSAGLVMLYAAVEIE